ncbi:BLUF domain-containing protein [bacterium]|nr:BLUF domain-containing protein [bacterium]
MAKKNSSSSPESQMPFRISYASRTAGYNSPARMAKIAAEAARDNLPQSISGVIVHDEGVNLQWLEGQANDVCELMSRISTDHRHKDVTVLEAGWIPKRRYANWPMHFIRPASDGISFELPIAPQGEMPCSPDAAEAAFNALAAVHGQIAQPDTPDSARAELFLSGLIAADGLALVEFPAETLNDLPARASLVDQTCQLLGRSWRDDTMSSFEIGLALAELNRMWQRAGRTEEPVCPNREICVVVPPGSSEIIGSIIKSDLIRASGASVHQVLENDWASITRTLSVGEQSPIIVAGPRVGLNDDADRANALANRLQSWCPGREVYLGGRAGGSISLWPDRLGLGAADKAPMRAESVKWLALAAIASIAESRQIH